MSDSPPVEWTNTTNTPSPIYFPSASPTPKLSSTPSKKPPSPVDWQQELLCDENNKEATEKTHHHHHLISYNAPSPPFTFDGDLRKPDLDALLEKLQQSTLSADTMTSSFVEELDDNDDEVQDDLIDSSSGSIELNNDNHNHTKDKHNHHHDHNHNNMKREESEQLRQWLEQLPDINQSNELEEILNSTSQKVKRASLMKVGKQFVTKMKKATGNK